MHHPTAEIIHGDALAVLSTMDTASVDAVITDPPYSSGGYTRGDRAMSVHAKYVQTDSMSGAELHAFAGDARDQRAYAHWCALWLGECLRVCRPGGVLCMFCDWRQFPAVSDAIQAGGWVWRGVVPWIKPGARPQPGRFRQDAEFVLWGSAGSFDGRRRSPLPGHFVMLAPRERDHITEKPLGLMRQLLDITSPGGTVLDPFTGAGTTGEAAILSGRNFVGVEITDHFHSVASRRLREAQRGYREEPSQLVLDEQDEERQQ